MVLAATTNIHDILDGHVCLEVDCVDRLYLNFYVARLQTSPQVNGFLREHLGGPVASPAVMKAEGHREFRPFRV